MKEEIEKIFIKYNLKKPKRVEKINIGFTNELYSIDDKYIIKICKNIENENNFRKESYFYKIFSGKIPVPKVFVYDENKDILKYNFLIIEKIDGDNLY